MSDTLPEVRILEALVIRLETIRQALGYHSEAGASVRLGYDASGAGDELATPALLLQLDSLEEIGRSGQRAIYRLNLNISAVTDTDSDATVRLLGMCHDLRRALASDNPCCREVRQQQLGETAFDIGAANSRLSFADMTLQLETVLHI